MRTKRIHFLLFLAFTTIIFFTSCSKNNNNGLAENQSTPTIVTNTPILSQMTSETENVNEKLENKITNAKEIDHVKSWIESTNPADNATDVDYSSSINIKFKFDMDEKSLNENNIVIQEGKHNSIITKLLNFTYNKETKTLKIDFKISGNGYGTSNSVLVFLSRNIENSQNEQMGVDVKFGFMTK